MIQCWDSGRDVVPVLNQCLASLAEGGPQFRVILVGLSRDRSGVGLLSVVR